MINLLPPAARKHATHEYWRRLAAVSMAISGVLFLAGAGLLAPAYMVVRSEQDAADRAEALAQQTLTDPQLSSAGAAIAQTSTLLKTISKKSGDVRPSSLLLMMAAARPSGVSVRQIAYSNSGKSITLSLGGVAATREGLLAYKTALAGLPGVTDADFPASNLAASTTVLYTMSVKYAPAVAEKSRTAKPAEDITSHNVAPVSAPATSTPTATSTEVVHTATSSVTH